MTPITDIAGPRPSTELRVIGLVAAAHFVSHYYILILPPLFTVIRADFAVTFTQLGLALTVFNVVSAVLQTPAGFLVDRVGARLVLVGGLLLGAVALTGASLLPSFWGFVAMFALLGLGNTVYHPADYDLLSRHISAARMGQAYSIHTFAGMLGAAVAPATLLFVAGAAGWRTAYLVAASLAFVVAILLLLFGAGMGRAAPAASASRAAETAADQGWGLLLSAPVLLNLLLFVLLALSNGAVQTYSVVVLDELYGTPLNVATMALTAYLAFSAIGVLVGGVIATRVPNRTVAMVGLCVTAACLLAIALLRLEAWIIIALLGLGGFSFGVIMPSRDLLVRAVTPPGAFGRVFGFVTTGFNIGGMVAPLLFGWMLDQGNPRGVFLAAVLFGLAAIPTVLANPGKAARS